MAKVNDTGLFQLENGNWAYRIFINRKNMKKIDTTCRQDENGNPFRTKKQAREARALKLTELTTTPKEEPKEEPKIKDVKLVDVYNAYMSSNIAKTKAPSTIRKQESMWENHILKNFGDKYISEISPISLKDYLHQLYFYGDGVDGYSSYSYKYVESFLKFFYLLFGVAYDNLWIDETMYNRMFVVRNTRLSMPDITQEDNVKYNNIKVYSLKEIKQLDKIFSRGNCYTAFLLGYYGGLRISEAYGVMVEDCNVIDKKITINKQLLYQNGSFCLCPVKTLESVRVIDIPDVLNEHLKNKIAEIMLNSNKESYRNYEVVIDKTKKQHEKIIGGSFINRKENGELLTPNSMKYWTRVIKEELNIDFLFHSLRKTHGTMMACANTPIKLLMKRLGHKKESTTLKYYIGDDLFSDSVYKRNLNSLDYSSVNFDDFADDPFV